MPWIAPIPTMVEPPIRLRSQRCCAFSFRIFPTWNDGTGSVPLHPKETADIRKPARVAGRKAIPNAVIAASLDGEASRRHGHRSRVARDSRPERLGTNASIAGLLLCARPERGPTAESGRKKSPVRHTIPASGGIFFPRTLGWVLMTTGYLPS
jgi:hypothetical protein